LSDNPSDPRSAWSIRPGVTYLNHGSFGPTPKPALAARREWSERLAAEPMDYFIRTMETHLDEAADRLGRFVGCEGRDLLFVDNATVGMNIVAANTALEPGDEILAGDQEYGAVLRVWRRVCQKAGAKLVVRSLPSPMTSAEEVAEALISGVTEKTKLLIVSHVTSPTATVLPVGLICRKARERGVPVCIDGPHAVAMRPIHLAKLDCDFYAASCHKWLSAPFGSGFLYVARRRQQNLMPTTTSWGGSLGGRPASWKDEFTWVGTRDPAAFLSIPAAIDFLETYGIEKFRTETHALAQYARERIQSVTGIEPLIPDSVDWYGSMIAMPLPLNDPPPTHRGWGHPLQRAFWEKHQIETPILNAAGRWLLRVSCHLYNTRADIDQLVDALSQELRSGPR
jgi:isopenicillin-N epimerase